ncbi:MAG TPA: terminase small subunit [Ruminococcus sp.]|nr:terminase small subunit [Ruminococcus sp.]
MALTEKQKRFVDEYLIDLNATQAAIRAGYSERTAAEQGARLLINVKVQNEISNQMKDREVRTEITQDMVVRELAAIAFSNGADYSKVVTKQSVDDMGNAVEYPDVELKNTDELTAQQKKAIAGIKQTKFGISVETCDKVKALELLGKHLGMFKDKVEVSGTLKAEQSKLDDLIKQMSEDE